MEPTVTTRGRNIFVSVSLPTCRRGSDLDVDVEASKTLVVEVPGATALRVPLPGEVDDDTIECKFDIHSKKLVVEMQLEGPGESVQNVESTASSSASAAYTRWDSIDDLDDDDDENPEDRELREMQERMCQLVEAENAQCELHEHVERIKREGPERALEDDIERLGLAQDMDDPRLQHAEQPSCSQAPPSSQQTPCSQALSVVSKQGKHAGGADGGRSLDYAR